MTLRDTSALRAEPLTLTRKAGAKVLAATSGAPSLQGRQDEGASRGDAPGVIDVVGLGDRAPLGRVAVLGGGEAAERVTAPQQARLDVVAGLGGGGADLDLDVDVL